MEHDRYTASPEVLAAHLEGEAVLLHMDTKDYFRLNDTAAWVWRLVFALLVLCGGTGVLVYLLMWILVPLEEPHFDSATPGPTAAT